MGHHWLIATSIGDSVWGNKVRVGQLFDLLGSDLFGDSPPPGLPVQLSIGTDAQMQNSSKSAIILSIPIRLRSGTLPVSLPSGGMIVNSTDLHIILIRTPKR